jgi:predicted cobalt transporter CbtA
MLEGRAGYTWGVAGYIYKTHTFQPSLGINQLP